MRVPLKFALTAAVGLSTISQAYGQVEIHKCETVDGSVVYQQLPCPADHQADAREDQPAVEPSAELPVNPEIADMPDVADDRDVEDSEQRDPDEVAACKQQYRDAIDRIDAEIRDGIASDALREYRERARALSQALSQC